MTVPDPGQQGRTECPGEQVAVHPVWGCDDEAIKDEFRRLQAERDKYLSWFQKADAELERLHFENEQREAGPSPVAGKDRQEERCPACAAADPDKECPNCPNKVEGRQEPPGATTGSEVVPNNETDEDEFDGNGWHLRVEADPAIDEWHRVVDPTQRPPYILARFRFLADARQWASELTANPTREAASRPSSSNPGAVPVCKEGNDE